MIHQPTTILKWPGIRTMLAAIGLTFGLAIVFFPAAHAQEYSDARVVRLSMVEGEVQVQNPGEATWEPALINLPLQQGYKLATGNGSAEIEFESGAVAYLADNSALQFTELALENGGRITRLMLTEGTARFYAHLGSADVFDVVTPDVTISPRERADFRVDVYSDGSSISVLQGDVSAAGAVSNWQVEKGQTLSVRAGDSQNATVAASPPEDDFDAWVNQRSEVVSTGSAHAISYLSSVNTPYTYGYGVADLYNYGSWSFVTGYGWGWQPSGIGAGWFPFSSGAWSFSPGLGFFWVSSEPWGWMPYHFGSWVYAPQGWVWIPGYFNQWQPAVVNWVRVGDQVGWVPRAPQDQPNKIPENLQHGVLVRSAAGTTFLLGGGAPSLAKRSSDNHRLEAERMRNVEVMRQPPASMARMLVPPPSRVTPTIRPAGKAPLVTAGVTPRVGTVITTGGDGDRSRAIIYDRSTHTYVNGDQAPVPPVVNSALPPIRSSTGMSDAGRPPIMIAPPAPGTVQREPRVANVPPGIQPQRTIIPRAGAPEPMNTPPGGVPGRPFPQMHTPQSTLAPQQPVSPFPTRPNAPANPRWQMAPQPAPTPQQPSSHGQQMPGAGMNPHGAAGAPRPSSPPPSAPNAGAGGNPHR